MEKQCVQYLTRKFTVCNAFWIKIHLLKKSHTDHLEFVSGTRWTSSVQVHLWNCSITLQCATPHTLSVCAELSLFTGLELGFYVLHVMVCNSGIRWGNGTQSPFTWSLTQTNFAFFMSSNSSLSKAENVSPSAGAVPDLWLTLPFFLKV